MESDSEPDHEQVIQKNRRNPATIVKIGMCFHLRSLNVQAAFGTITILYVPFVVTKFLLLPNMQNKLLLVAKHENLKISKVILYSPSEKDVQD